MWLMGVNMPTKMVNRVVLDSGRLSSRKFQGMLQPLTLHHVLKTLLRDVEQTNIFTPNKE